MRRSGLADKIIQTNQDKMYRGFNLTIGKIKEEYLVKGRVDFEINKKLVSDDLTKFLSPRGKLNGTQMQHNWFPSVKADIFISHSHNDENEAIKLAGWLKEIFDLDCFIDSCIWGNSNDLLKTLDNEYCLNVSENTYSYQKRNSSTSHVHVMLSTALAKMIERTECLIFLNTPNSVATSDIITKTASPWIYMEIALSQLVRKPLELHRNDLLKSFSESDRLQKSLSFEYELSLNNFTEINENNLTNWRDKWHAIKRGNPLDVLYSLHKVIRDDRLLHS